MAEFAEKKIMEMEFPSKVHDYCRCPKCLHSFTIFLCAYKSFMTIFNIWPNF